MKVSEMTGQNEKKWVMLNCNVTHYEYDDTEDEDAETETQTLCVIAVDCGTEQEAIEFVNKYREDLADSDLEIGRACPFEACDLGVGTVISHTLHDCTEPMDRPDPDARETVDLNDFDYEKV